MLRDANQCQFIPVCIPESMVLLETGRLISNLKNIDISVSQIIINNVMESDGCSFCIERKISQQKYMEQINTTYLALNRVIVPLFPSEVKGLEKLDHMRISIFNH